MSHTTHQSTGGYDPFADPNADVTRQAKEDAPDDIGYQLLLEASYRLDDYYGQQSRFVLLVAGRLGLRRSEIAHMKEGWIDWRRSMIHIPAHDPCEKGRGGGACGECRLKSKQERDHNEDVSFADAVGDRWHPKTSAAARAVPFDFDPRAQLSVERFFDRYDEWPVSYQAVGRRVKRVAREATGIDVETTYPHCLRAHAASFHANRGLKQLPLKAMMGWASMETAKSYIATSGENTARALRSVHTQ